MIGFVCCTCEAFALGNERDHGRKKRKTKAFICFVGWGIYVMMIWVLMEQFFMYFWLLFNKTEPHCWMWTWASLCCIFCDGTKWGAWLEFISFLCSCFHKFSPNLLDGHSHEQCFCNTMMYQRLWIINETFHFFNYLLHIC